MLPSRIIYTKTNFYNVQYLNHEIKKINDRPIYLTLLLKIFNKLFLKLLIFLF